MNEDRQNYISALPFEQTDLFQNMYRTPPVRFAHGEGISQTFRGTVATQSTLVLHTSPISTQSLELSLTKGANSTLLIFTHSNPSGTGMNLSHNEKIGNGKPADGAARRALDRIKKLNRIKSIIQAPIDQVMKMEIAFGEKYSGDNMWKGNYTSRNRYKLMAEGSSPVAMIKLTCDNPINPGWFSFTCHLKINPKGATDPYDYNGQSIPPMSDIRTIKKRQYVPVGAVSSARPPSVIGNIPAGSETNGLDALAEQNHILDRDF